MDEPVEVDERVGLMDILLELFEDDRWHSVTRREERVHDQTNRR